VFSLPLGPVLILEHLNLVFVLDRLRIKAGCVHGPHNGLVPPVLQRAVAFELFHSELADLHLSVVGHEVLNLSYFGFGVLFELLGAFFRGELHQICHLTLVIVGIAPA
jgi:hypothetical protein